jgi:hypothetical protein
VTLPVSDIIALINTIHIATFTSVAILTEKGLVVMTAKLDKSAILVDYFVHFRRGCCSNPPGWEITILKDTNQFAHLVPFNSVGKMLSENVCAHLIGFAVRDTKLAFAKTFM